MDTPTNLGLDSQPQPPSQLQPPSMSPAPKKGFVLGILGVAAGLFLAYFRARAWSYGMITPEVLGYAIGTALIPALVAYLIAGRKSVRKFNRFGLWFAGISILTYVISNPHPVSLEHHIADLMKEAAGTKAVDEGGPSDMDSMIRGFMQDILAERKAFDRNQQALSPVLNKLYSAESFSSKGHMQKSIDAVRGVLDVDLHNSERLESIPQMAEARLKQTSFSDSDKEGFMEGIRKAYGDSKVLKIRRDAMEAEKQWADSTVGLYQFAIANAADIRVAGPKLVISNSSIRDGFNSRLKTSREQHSQISKFNEQLETAQREVMQEYGVTKKDLGLEKTEVK